MDTQTQQVPGINEQLRTIETEVPIQSDVSESIPLEQQLKSMTKPQLIKKADDMGYTVDGRLGEKTIIENILKIDADRKSSAQKANEESLAMAVTEEDPVIEVRFFNLESASADVEFAYSGKRGMYGPEYEKDGKKYGNPKGFKKCPKYHLFPGEKIKLAYSVYEYLTSLTFVTHKTVFDPVSGMIQGNIPIIKPRFILQTDISREDILTINKNK